MTEYRRNPDSQAEKLIVKVFNDRERAADSQIARLHFENRLAGTPHRPRVRNSLKAALFLTALLLLGSWATGLPAGSMDDAQQILIELPSAAAEVDFNFWTAVFANHAAELNQIGGHSLVVDFVSGSPDQIYLQLGILGINYSDANTWIRSVIAAEPQLINAAYSVTQPLVPYTITVGDMLAYKLGTTSSIEQNVVRAWYSIDEHPSYIYLIAHPEGKVRNTQRFLY